jgi:tetratricopeptide (TPR) repeat protein
MRTAGAMLVAVMLAGIAACQRDVDTPAPAPVAEPDYGALESGVAQSLRDARARFDAAVADAAAPAAARAQAYGDIAMAYHAHRLLDLAEAGYRNAVLLDPADYRWRYLLGYLYQQQGAHARAVDALRAALERNPDYAPAALRLAHSLAELNRLPEAGAALSPALSDARTRLAAEVEKGRIALLEGRYADAVDQLRGVLEQAPGPGRIHQYLGLAYRGMGDLERAQEHLARGGGAEPAVADPLLRAMQQHVAGSRVDGLRAEAAMRAGDYASAAAGFQRALRADPDSVPLRINLAYSLMMLGEPEAARDHFRRVVELDPQQYVAHYNLGLLAARAGRDDEAIAAFRAALRANPDYARAHVALADALMRAGEFEAAARHHRAAITLDPTLAVARLREALCLVRAGREAEARQRLEEATAANPRQAELWEALARVLSTAKDASLRDGDRALEIAQALLRSRENLSHGRTMALALAESGHFNDAVAVQETAIALARRQGVSWLLPTLQAELAGYRQRHASRSGWAADDPLFRPAANAASADEVGTMSTATAGGAP